MRRALALAAIAGLSGCAAMVDGIYHLAGPQAHSARPGAALATGRVDSWREIVVDPKHGLVCRDVGQPWVRHADLETDVTNPNGFKAATQFFTVVEVLVLGLVVGLHEHSCATEGCGARTSFYPWLAPFAADVAWGTYRSFTIHDEILRSTDLRWGGASVGEAAMTIADRCSVGTEIPLFAGGDQLVVHVGDGGWMVAAELPVLAAFVAAHLDFAVGGDHVRLDASRAPALVAALLPPKVPPPRPPVEVVVPRLPTEVHCGVRSDGTAACGAR